MSEEKPVSRRPPPRPTSVAKRAAPTAEKAAAKPPSDKPPKTNKYVVAPGHKFALERGRFVGAGQIVELDAKMAKMLNERGAIRPHIAEEEEEDDDDDDDDDDVATAPEPASSKDDTDDDEADK